MSAHEEERLSGYLDDELPPAERAAVERHLAACAECRGFLAALAEVDTRAAGIPAAAPDGYFDTFAARVRGRIEAQGRARRRVLRVPAWGWALAAALLLAVVTPLTLNERPGAPASRPGRDDSAGALASAPAQAPSLPAREGGALGPAQGAPEPGPRQKRSLPAASAAHLQKATTPEGPGGGGFASAPAGAVLAMPSAAARARAPATLPAAEEKTAAKGEAADAAAQPAPAAATPQAMAAAPPVQNEALGRLAADLLERRADSRGERAELDYRRLEAAQASRTEEWRALRERWRAFAASYPGSPRADEARVRVVACGLEALRGGRGETDRAALERDAAEYLARPDALQTLRVRALLETAANR